LRAITLRGLALIVVRGLALIVVRGLALIVVRGLAPDAQGGNNGARGEGTRTMSDSATSSEPGIKVRSYFPTPVVVAQVPLSDEENAALRGTILTREESVAGVAHSNLLGWQSADDFAQWGGTQGEKLLGLARALADRLNGDRAGKRVAVNWFVTAWANINRCGNELIPPKTGQMLPFPAWLGHGVRPYLGPGTRISVAGSPMAGSPMTKEEPS